MATGDIAFEANTAKVREESTDYVEGSSSVDPRSVHKVVMSHGTVTAPASGVAGSTCIVTLEYEYDVGDNSNMFQAGETPFDATKKYNIKITEA